MVHIVHNCHAHSCQITSTRIVLQERLQTAFKEDEILHTASPDDLIMNLAQLRNACYVQQFQPPSDQSRGTQDKIIERAIINRELLDSTAACAREHVTTIPSSSTLQPLPQRRRKRAATVTSATDQSIKVNATAETQRDVLSASKRSRTQTSPRPNWPLRLDGGALLETAASGEVG